MADKKVQDFIDNLELMDPDKFEMVQLIRKEMKTIKPDTGERMMYGGIMFSLGGNDLGGVFVNKKHISIEFTSGYQLSDPKGVLEGTGKFRRHIKIRSMSDIAEKDVTFFLRQIA